MPVNSGFDNPWHAIPLEDYETHMAWPSVGQLAVLSELFAEALSFVDPDSVAILGIAGGNGLERIDPSRTTRVCGIDINSAYLEATGRRFASLRGLELYQVDLADIAVAHGPFAMVHAALIFEHAGLELALENAARMTDAGGCLSVVLQLPAIGEETEISPSPVTTIHRLQSSFRLIEPDRLRERLSVLGLKEVGERRRPLPGGKALWMGIFRREG